MKNVLLSFAGLFVERVPVDERGTPMTGPAAATTPPTSAPVPPPAGSVQAPPAGSPGPAPLPLQVDPFAGAPVPMQAPGGTPGAAPVAPGAPAGPAATPGGIAVALRAWVPQEYAAHLAPFGLHVIAAGGAVTADQAQAWGADVLVISAECLGTDTQLIQQPTLPTVFITPQPVMLPPVPGLIQVQEPLRASDVAHAVREARAAFAAGTA